MNDTEFTANDVQALRQATGVGMMDAKSALAQCGGDLYSAAQWLRETGAAKSVDMTGRDNSEGAVVGGVIHDGPGQVGGLVQLRCETDFVAKTESFLELAEKLLNAVLMEGVSAVSDFSVEVAGLGLSLKENISIGDVVRYSTPKRGSLDVYVHHQNGRGVNGVLVEGTGVGPDDLHGIALHIASVRPSYVSIDDIPAEVIESERGTLYALTRNEGKPEAALEKIVGGRMRGFFKTHVLMEQKYVKNEKRTIADVVGSGTIDRFAQIEIG